MDLILWRHAEAEEGAPDLERSLTAKGERQAKKMAEFLRPRLPHSTRILVSPARRTQQTAQALTRDFITAPSIAPGASAAAVLESAAWPDAGGCTLIVGHQPALGEAAARIMAGGRGSWSIRKGAVWWMVQRDHETALRLIISPDLL